MASVFIKHTPMRPWPSGYNAWLTSVRSSVRVSAESSQTSWPGRFIDMLICGGLYMVLLKQKDPLELFVKRRVLFPVSSFYLVAI